MKQKEKRRGRRKEENRGLKVRKITRSETLHQQKKGAGWENVPQYPKGLGERRGRRPLDVKALQVET